MPSLQGLAAKIESDRAAVEAVAGPIDSSKGQAEHTASALGGLGVEVASERMRGVVDKIEEAESMRAALQALTPMRPTAAQAEATTEVIDTDETAEHLHAARTPDHLVHYARERMTTWILGRPED